MRCAVWRQAAENVAESLQRGMRVIVQGRLKSRSFETREGEKRTSFEIDVDEVGPSLRSATAKVTQTEPLRRRGLLRRPRRPGRSGGGGGQQQSQPASDPWATPAPAGGGQQQQSQPGNDPWAAPAGGSSNDEPPF